MPIPENYYEYLNQLVELHPDEFKYKDEIFNGFKYRIFMYRQECKPETFLRYPASLECRGHMFDITNPDDIKLVCVPLRKFFNYNEAEITREENINWGELVDITTKYDGTLLTSYIHGDGSLQLKTKLTLDSIFTQKGMQFLQSDPIFYEFIKSITILDKEYPWKSTNVCMEYCDEFNQIVVKYAEPVLKIICVRTHTGATLYRDDFPKEYHRYFIESVKMENQGTKLVDQIAHMSDIEGFVFRFKNGLCMKVKTFQFCLLAKFLPHFNDDLWLKKQLILSDNAQAQMAEFIQINRPELLERFNLIVNELILEWKNIQNQIESIYQEDKKYNRKEFALKYKEHPLFSLLMQRYSNQEMEINKYLLKEIEKIKKERRN